MVAADRLMRSLCWALIVFAIGAAVLSATTAVNPFSTDIPDNTDLVDRLITFRSWDQQLYPWRWLAVCSPSACSSWPPSWVSLFARLPLRESRGT